MSSALMPPPRVGADGHSVTALLLAPVSRGQVVSAFEHLRRRLAQEALGTRGVFPGFDVLEFNGPTRIDEAVGVAATIRAASERRHVAEYTARVRDEAGNPVGQPVAEARGLTLDCSKPTHPANPRLRRDRS